MTLQQAIFNRLSTFAGLSALIGTRVYPIRAPQDPTHPLVLYSQVSGPRIRTMGSTDLGGQPRYQFVCEAKTYLQAKAVAAQVRAALDRYTGTMGGSGGVVVQACLQENEIDDYEPQTATYQVVLDFIFWHEGD